MNKPPKKPKSRLQIEREIKGWSRKYVANEIQVSEYTIGQWERGEHVPYPEHIQKLCTLFDKNADALGLAGIPAEMIVEILAEVTEEQDCTTISSPHEQQREDSAFVFNSAIAGTTISSRSGKRMRLLFYTCGIVLALAIVFCVFAYEIHPFSPIHIKPGGEWISPVGPILGDSIYFAAYAYPTHTGEPEIDHVNFTVFWPGVDPRTWIIACVARTPVRKDVFACNANLRLLGAQPGHIKISFDVYDRQGNVNFAPNGEHTITYLPSLQE